MAGYTDKPIESKISDTLGMSVYAAGMSSFVRSCDTPMTISIQGEWGSGKTSLMNMMKEELRNEAITVWFNTWQYSLMNEDDDLTTSLLYSFLKQLGGKGNVFKEFKKILGKGVLLAAAAAGKYYIGESPAVDDFVNTLGSNKAGYIEEIESLRTKIQQAVDSATAELGKERVIVFIDDLDRLHPVRAVELIEVINVFLGCDKCVFVLAIDYEIVSQGIKEKYGAGITSEKGRNFFDKIIQMPFNMPVAQFSGEKYIRELAEKAGVEDYGTIIEISEIIRLSIGAENPRELKRVFNRFLFLREMMNTIFSAPSELYEQDRVLFAIICMQLEFEELYDVFVKNLEGFRYDNFEQRFKSLLEGWMKKEAVAEFLGTDDDKRIGRMTVFLKKCLNGISFTEEICDLPGNLNYRNSFAGAMALSWELPELFYRALKITQITTVEKNKVELNTNRVEPRRVETIKEIAGKLGVLVQELAERPVEPCIAKFQYPNELTMPVGGNVHINEKNCYYLLCYNIYVDAKSSKTALQITLHDESLGNGDEFMERFGDYKSLHDARWCGPEYCGLTYTLVPDSDDEIIEHVVSAVREVNYILEHLQQ